MKRRTRRSRDGLRGKSFWFLLGRLPKGTRPGGRNPPLSGNTENSPAPTQQTQRTTCALQAASRKPLSHSPERGETLSSRPLGKQPSASWCKPIQIERKSPAQDRAFSQSAEGSVDLGVQLPTGITLEHAFQRDRLDLRGVAGSAEGFVTGDADVAHGIDGLRKILAR